MIMIRNVFIAVLVTTGLAAGCDRAPEPGVAARGPTGSGLRATACSELAVSVGVAESEWVLQSTRDQESPNSMIRTSDVAVAADGSLFVVDSREAKVIHLDSRGRVLNEWGKEGDGPGEFRKPLAIAVGPDQNIYVGDTRGRVSVFTREGASQGTISLSDRRQISDLIVLPNGNLVVATDVIPLESYGAFVMIVDPDGKAVRDVLIVPYDGTVRARPLLGHAYNPVRLSPGSAGEFAVWYPMDNFVEVFDSSAVQRGKIEGCLPKAIQESYARQSRQGFSGQSFVRLTGGVRFDATGGIQVASFHDPPEGRTLRIRRFALNGSELEARDFDISEPGGPWDRSDFLGDSLLIAFSTRAAELGILKLRMR